MQSQNMFLTIIWGQVIFLVLFEAIFFSNVSKAPLPPPPPPRP